MHAKRVPTLFEEGDFNFSRLSNLKFCDNDRRLRTELQHSGHSILAPILSHSADVYSVQFKRFHFFCLFEQYGALYCYVVQWLR